MSRAIRAPTLAPSGASHLARPTMEVPGMRRIGSILMVTVLAGCAAVGSPAAPSAPASGDSTDSSISIPSASTTAPSTAPSASGPASLPVGAEPPSAPTGLTAVRHAVPCESPIGVGPVVISARFAGTGPGCVTVDLGWIPAPGTDAVYRIYQTWSGEGADAACRPALSLLVAVSAPNVTAMTVGPLETSVGGGGRCLYVAAANSAGESARVQFSGSLSS